MKKHAYLIIAHNEPVVLKTLLKALDDARNDIYLHIDSRAVSLFEEIKEVRLEKGRLYVLKNRIAVHWGDISQVKVEYLLFESALKHGKYEYYHLLSGVDLPIKSQDYIHDFFARYAGKEFVGFWNDEKHQRDLHRKVFKYYLFTKHLRDKKTIKHICAAPIRNVFLGLQKAISFSRSHHWVFKKGFNWVSITHDFCVYLVSMKQQVLKTFRYTLCPDEIFVQTLLWNSPFRENIYSLEDALLGSMRVIDWERGNPHVWQKEDEEILKTSKGLFARKFASNYLFIIDKAESVF